MVKNIGVIQVLDFTGMTPRQSEVNRLKKEVQKQGELPKMEREGEAILADLWQQYFDVQLVRYDDRYHKINSKGNPDFAQKDLARLPKEWQTLDLMYSIEQDTDIEKYLDSIDHSARAWRRQKENIIQHIEKSDIVPLFLRAFDAQRLDKVLRFVLSLPLEQQQKLVVIL